MSVPHEPADTVRLPCWPPLLWEGVPPAVVGRGSLTVVAWDGKTLAADKRGCQYGLTYTVTKIFRSGDRIIGIAGQADRIGEFRSWFDAGANPKKYPNNEDDNNATYCIAIRSDGTIERYESTGWPIIVEEPFHASGSGRDYAMAAMHLGCNAVKAVEVACRFNESCGNGIDVLTFERP